MKEKIRVCLIWHRLGPYHVMRARALAEVSEASIIEMCAKDTIYAWDIVPTDHEKFHRYTLFPDSDVNDAPWLLIRTRLWDALDKINPDVVFINSWSANYSLMALQWCRLRKKARVVYADSAYNDKPRKAWLEGIKRTIVKNFQVAFVGGSRHTNYMETLGIRSDRCVTGYNCVDNDYFALNGSVARSNQIELRAKLALPKRYFLSTCRFTEKKNLLRLLSGYAEFNKAQQQSADPVHLVILGDGPLRSAIEDTIERLSLKERVHLPGFRQYDETPVFYGLAEAFVLPSLIEQWGLVVNEAMSTGLPVIVSQNCNCVPELVQDGKNGYVFDPLNVTQLAEILHQVANLDSFRREDMTRAGQRIASGFSMENFAKNVATAARLAMSLPNRNGILSRVTIPILIRQKNKLDY